MAARPLAVKLLRPEATLPSRGSAAAAGLDLFASEDVVLRAGRHAAVSTGIAVALPESCVGLVWPRSGLAARHGIDTLAGVIDGDYRGEIKVVLINHGAADYPVKRGDRIAQLLVQRVEMPEPVRSEDLVESPRGAGGFGSTGR